MHKKRLLAIDVGNTNTVMGVFEDQELTAEWRLATPAPGTTVDELAATLLALLQLRGRTFADIDVIAVSSVVPSLDGSLARLGEEFMGISPLFVGPGVRTGFRLQVENPKEVGADRIVNCLAAFHKYGGPAIVIDFGTAITYDVISEEGDFLGGAIAPGINVSVQALTARAAKLFQIDLVAPRSAIGRNTVTNLQSGIIFGFVSQVEGMVQRLRAEMGPAKVIATGGQAPLLAAHTDVIEAVDPWLTLEGLRLIHEINPDLGGRSASEAPSRSAPPPA